MKMFFIVLVNDNCRINRIKIVSVFQVSDTLNQAQMISTLLKGKKK